MNTNVQLISLRVNVANMSTDLKPEDEDVPGIYLVSFPDDGNGHLLPDVQASMALDIFHAHIGIKVLDDFEIAVLSESGARIDPCEEATDCPDAGFVEKVCNQPFYVLGSDRELSADQLLAKYTSAGIEEHPQFSLLAWRSAVAALQTTYGYWVWVASQLVAARVN